MPAPNVFDSVLVPRPKSSRFDLSHDVKTSGSFGTLIPIMCRDMLPGTTFKMQQEVFLRAMPLVTPVMHNVNCYVHNFYVPYRILFADWDNFLRGGKNNQTEYQIPIFRVTASEYNYYIAHHTHIGDYFGLPKIPDPLEDATRTFDIVALPFLAYQMIYENYYADQNVENLVFDEVKKYIDANPIITSSSRVQVTNIDGTPGQTINILDWCTQIRNRCWEHDYFTSALPNTQRGADVHLPIYGTAPLQTFGNQSSSITSSNGSLLNNASVIGVNLGDATLRAITETGYQENLGVQGYDPITNSFAGTQTARVNVTHHTRVDLSQALGATINDFREAMQLQRYNEIVQRTGNRIKEWYRGIFGISVPDYRLDLPEYLGGGKAPMIISEVLQQSQTTDSSPQGTMSGRAISASSYGVKKHFFPEYGVVISILSMLPRSAYSQGMPKMFTKKDRFDFGLPIFANLGEQAVTQGEVYWANDGKNDDTFGYVPRYSEYKYIPSMITGDMRETLSEWHLGRIFSERPYLNRDFVHTDKDNLNRIFAVVADVEPETFVIQVLNHVRVRQPLPYYSNPI